MIMMMQQLKRLSARKQIISLRMAGRYCLRAYSTHTIVERIFEQNASMDGHLSPGSPFSDACNQLAAEFPQLKALSDDGMIGRAFQYMDFDADGRLSRDEFVHGVGALTARSPKDSAARRLLERLAAGSVAEPTTDYAHVRSVAVLGAGVAGLQVACELAGAGLEVAVLEKSGGVGGVWRRNYADFGLQVPRELYEFPDYPYPEGGDEFPSGPEVQAYIEAFARDKGLLELVQFNTEVLELAPRGGGRRGWRVAASTAGGEPQHRSFDFFVVASGMYSTPNLPRVPGQELFQGRVLHSCDFTDAAVAEGKRVVVVGGGKSAIDCAVAAAKAGGEATLAFRVAHWPVPRHLCNLVPFKFGTYSRFGHAMLPSHYDTATLSWYLHGVLSPVKWAWWRVVELMFRLQFRLKGDLLPATPIEKDVFSGGQILSYEFRDMLAAGRVRARKCAIERFDATGVVLADGARLPCDLVVYATGFSKSYRYLDRMLQGKLKIEKDGLYLYRNILPPALPDLAFVGAEVSTFNNILTHGLQAAWLRRALVGGMGLPSPEAMERAVEREAAWKRSWMPASPSRASIFQLHMMKYHDALVKDMGESHLRKGFNLAAELFAPYSARDYVSIFRKCHRATNK